MSIFHFLESVSWVFGTILVVALFILTTTLGIVLARKFISRKTLQAHHDVAGFVFTNLGVLYSVLLGFTVVNVQSRFEKTNEIAEVEASYLADLYRDSAAFPEKDKNTIRSSIDRFIKSVIFDEWPLMSKGKISANATNALQDIWEAYYNLTPANSKELVWYTESVSKLNLLVNARLMRVMGGAASLGTEMWVFLIVGGFVLATFISFFGLDNLYSHLLMGAALSGATAFLLFLIYTLDTAFSGDVMVYPEAMIRVLKSFNEM